MHGDAVPGSNQSLISLLIVEDEPRYLESTRLLLAQYVHSIDAALSVAQAMALLAERSYDLALLDLRLPDGSGHEIMAYIRAHHPDCRIIVASGDSEIDSAIQSLRLGAYDYLRKPYEPEELIKTVRNVVRKLQLERDNARMVHQIEQSEQWHRLLVNASPDVIYTLDANGRFTYLNDSIEGTLGYMPGELIGRDYRTIIAQDQAEIALHHFNERRTGDRATRNFELLLRRKDDLLSSLTERTSDQRSWSNCPRWACIARPAWAWANSSAPMASRATSARASRPKPPSHSRPITTCSPACPTARCSRTAWARRWCRPSATARPWRRCSSTWITSRWSTTPSAIWSATACCKRWRNVCAAACARATRCRASAATNSCCCCRTSVRATTPPISRRKSSPR